MLYGEFSPSAMPGPGKAAQSSAIVHYLASLGIHIQPGKTGPGQEKKIVPPSAGGLFGVPLHLLPLSDRVKGVPQFLVDACELLRPHLHVEGLFRKCGSMTRIRALKARLEAGERCLGLALPCDVATLVKQFLRGLPEPLIPEGLQEPLCLVQRRKEEDSQGALVLLLTCLLPQRSADTLRYLCGFLRDVAARCAQNKMDLANLAVVFAPNLFPQELCSQLGERTEEQLQARVGVVRALLSHASGIGVPPQPLMEKVQAAFSEPDIEGHPPAGPEEARGSSRDERRRRRHCVGHIVTEALSQFRMGRPPCTAPSQDSREHASGDIALQAAFISKRKASEDTARTPNPSTKKRRSALDSLGSGPFDEDAADCSDQPTEAGSVPIASTSPVPDDSGGTLNSLSDAGGGPANSWTPLVTTQRKGSRSQKRPQRKHSVCTSPRCSPASLECRGTGRKTLRIFSCNSKGLVSASQQLLCVSAKAAEPSGWLGVKKTAGASWGGPAAPHRWPERQDYKLTDAAAGSVLQPSSDDSSAPTGANPGLPHAMKCEPGAEPSPCLDGLASGLRRLDLHALLGGGEVLDMAVTLAEDTRTPGHCRVLRRSISWPEELSVRDAAEEGDPDLSLDDAPPVGGGHRAQMSSLAEIPQLGAEGTVAGVGQLGIPAGCVTPANAGVEGEGQRPRPQSLLPARPGLADGRLSLARRFRCLSRGPSASLTHPSSQPSEGPCAARLSPPRRQRGRQFGRSVSHESALPWPAGQEGGLARAPGQAKKGASVLPHKSPLQFFKASCGRQIFITRKHIAMSLAGLRGKREATSPRDPELPSSC